MSDLLRRFTVRSIGLLMIALALSLTVSAQDETDEEGPCENRYGDNEMETKKNLSMFNQFIQSKEYEKAYDYYRYLLVHAPCVQKRVLFSGAVITETTMSYIGQNDMEAYKARFKGLRDTLFMSYEKRIEHWGQEGYVKGKWANAIATYDPSRLNEALQMFSESVKMEGYKTDDKVPSWYIAAAINGLKKEIIDQDSLYKIYFRLMDIVIHNKAEATDNLKSWEYAEQYLNSSMTPYLECDKLESFFAPKIKASPDDLELKKTAVTLMAKSNCESGKFYLKIAEDVAIAEPTAEAFISVAKGNLALGNKSKARDLYLKAASMLPDGPEKREVYSKLMSLYYGEKNYTKAQTYANKVLALDPNNGHAYLVLAGVYAGMTTSCTDDKIEGKSMYWLAYDMAKKASATPETAEEAGKLMATFQTRFISKADAFIRNFVVSEGDPFTIPCVGITTTVRYRPE